MSQMNNIGQGRRDRHGSSIVRRGGVRLKTGSHATGSVQGESDPKEKRTTYRNPLVFLFDNVLCGLCSDLSKSQC